jgi:pyrimidine operon attenuation protein/uracil phosphoribosyltransferase
MRIMGAQELGLTLSRIAREILERNVQALAAGNLALVGIKRRGVPLAQRLAREIKSAAGQDALLGELDITLYRDDLQLVAAAPIVRGSKIEFDLKGKVVVLVDDVLFTGRTIRAAISELLDFGRCQAIQLAALIDRGHRELPIAADYVGKVIQTDPGDLVDIKVKEEDGEDGVFLTRK